MSSLREAFSLCPNFVLYWEVIRFGCANGYRVLDLGRSFRNAGIDLWKRVPVPIANLVGPWIRGQAPN